MAHYATFITDEVGDLWHSKLAIWHANNFDKPVLGSGGDFLAITTINFLHCKHPVSVAP